jgi:hypothetical protein
MLLLSPTHLHYSSLIEAITEKKCEFLAGKVFQEVHASMLLAKCQLITRGNNLSFLCFYLQRHFEDPIVEP